ncbi:receptor L domain protein [Ancylostoma caninum]|uniref:Receptor L domain protein n=1 Tax=Ancylostoma caninum TaxID=29170 RepID=A0A368FAI7_ANCCA|nr:receptor L domain protein [Ancylostoma caninum]
MPHKPTSGNSCKAVPLTLKNVDKFHNCKSILGNVELIDWTDNDEELIEIFSNVEEIHGQLRVVNTSIKFTAKLFKSLRRIDSSYTGGAAIVIEDNDGLEIIEMKSLESIRSEDPTSVIIRQPNTVISPLQGTIEEGHES